jgi:hypothetical protein
MNLISLRTSVEVTENIGTTWSGFLGIQKPDHNGDNLQRHVKLTDYAWDDSGKTQVRDKARITGFATSAAKKAIVTGPSLLPTAPAPDKPGAQTTPTTDAHFQEAHAHPRGALVSNTT